MLDPSDCSHMRPRLLTPVPGAQAYASCSARLHMLDPSHCSRLCLLLRVGPGHQLAERELVVPIRVDTPLPDYLVHKDTFDKGFLRFWAPGDRFRMFFGAKSAARAGGLGLPVCL